MALSTGRLVKWTPDDPSSSGLQRAKHSTPAILLGGARTTRLDRRPLTLIEFFHAGTTADRGLGPCGCVLDFVIFWSKFEQGVLVFWQELTV